MNDEHDNDLRELFAGQRRRDHEIAPVWREGMLHAPARRSSSGFPRWIPLGLATACIALAAVFLTHESSTGPSLSQLPPLFETSGEELFAGLEPSFPAFDAPSDFLLPTHLNLHLP